MTNINKQSDARVLFYAIANASNCIVYAAVAGPGLALTPTPHVQEI